MGYSVFVAANGGNDYWTSEIADAQWNSFGNIQTAIVFEITDTGYELSGYYYWFEMESTLVPGGFALWKALSGDTGTVVDGSVITSLPTPTETGWQYVELDTPVPLDANTPYKIELAASGGFYWTTDYTPFMTTGIVNGPLNVYSDQAADGSNNSIYGDYQGSFGEPETTVPGTSYPGMAYESGAPAIDVLIQETGGVSASITGVAAEIIVAGGTGSVSVSAAVSITGIAAEIVLAGGIGLPVPLEVTLTGTTAGIMTYSTFSEINNTADAGNQDMRVLAPSSPSPNYDHAFLWLLPVEPGQGTSYGDSIATVKTLNAHDEYNLTCIQPGFPLDPWYANNVDDPKTQQETFILQLVNWAERTLAITHTEKHYLIGFSKSGFGGQVLFLRNQGVFEKAASWDAACDYQTLDQYDGADVFGEQSQLDAYALYDPNLQTWKANGDTDTQNRIWLGAGINLVEATSDYADRLTTDGILHTYSYVEVDSHNWAPTPGWVGPALAAMFGVQIAGTAAEIIMAGGIGSVTSEDAVSISGVAAELVISGTAGSVSTGDSVSVSGAAAELVISGTSGSVSTGDSVRISGSAAHLIFTGALGSITALKSVSISGKSAPIIITGGRGSLPGSSGRSSPLFIFSQI